MYQNSLSLSSTETLIVRRVLRHPSRQKLAGFWTEEKVSHKRTFLVHMVDCLRNVKLVSFETVVRRFSLLRRTLPCSASLAFNSVAYACSGGSPQLLVTQSRTVAHMPSRSTTR